MFRHQKVQLWKNVFVGKETGKHAEVITRWKINVFHKNNFTGLTVSQRWEWLESLLFNCMLNICWITNNYFSTNISSTHLCHKPFHEFCSRSCCGRWCLQIWSRCHEKALVQAHLSLGFWSSSDSSALKKETGNKLNQAVRVWIMVLCLWACVLSFFMFWVFCELVICSFGCWDAVYVLALYSLLSIYYCFTLLLCSSLGYVIFSHHLLWPCPVSPVSHVSMFPSLCQVHMS